MKIDLSKYPPGTKLKLKNGEVVFLIGKCHTKDHESDYVIEHNGWQGLGYRRQDGTHPLCESPQHIESVIQPDKYLISYLTEQDEVSTIVLPIDNSKALNEAVLLPIVSLKTSSMLDMIPGCSKRAVKILSWSKIEE